MMESREFDVTFMVKLPKDLRKPMLDVLVPKECVNLPLFLIELLGVIEVCNRK